MKCCKNEHASIWCYLFNDNAWSLREEAIEAVVMLCVEAAWIQDMKKVGCPHCGTTGGG
jgi:hypothetical protein